MGTDYQHAEARKSPCLDGKVERDQEGKEIRYPVLLSAREKLISRKVVWAFGVRYAAEMAFLNFISACNLTVSSRGMACSFFTRFSSFLPDNVVLRGHYYCDHSTNLFKLDSDDL